MGGSFSLPNWLIDYDAFEQTVDATFYDIGVITLANVVVALGFFVYWTYKRWHDPNAFSSKRAARPEPLPGPQKGLIAWAWALASIDEAEVLKYAGFDALVYIRMYLLATKICLAFASYAWLIVLPINVTGGNEAATGGSTNNFALMSLSNVMDGSARLWVHAVGMLLLTGSAYFFLNGEFKTYIRLRHLYLKLRAPHMRTIMLQDVPPRMCGAAQLYVYFNHLYPNSVEAVACCQELKPLAKVLEQREQVITELERELVACEKAGMVGPSAEVMQLRKSLDTLNATVGRLQTQQLHRLREMDKRVLREAREAAAAVANDGGVGRRPVPLWSMTRVREADVLDDIGEVTNSDNEEEEQEGDVRNWMDNDEPELKVAMEKATSAATAASIGGDSADQLQHENRDSDDIILCSFFESPSKWCAGCAHRVIAWTKACIQWVKKVLHIKSASEYDDEEEGLSLLPRLPKDGTGDMRVELGPKAFVTFKTFAAATVARQVHHAAKPELLRAYGAPEPRDVYWFNAYVARSTRRKRRIVVDTFLALLYLFWVVPVTLLYLTFSRENLIAGSSWLKDRCGDGQQELICLSLDMVQPILLLGLMNVLPPLIRVLGMLEGIAAESWNQRVALSRYFWFQVINVFLVTTVAGTIFDTISMIVEDPTKTLTLLGESLPKVCGFFVMYILIKLFVGLSIEITRFFSLLQHWTRMLVWWPRSTKRDRRKVILGMRPYEDAGWFNFPKYVAQDLLVIVVTFTYACINPFILLVSITYFICAHLTYKHQMLFVYEPVYESGGMLFPKIFRRFIFGIVVAQATTGGALLLKGGYVQAGCLVALMICTIVFKTHQRSFFEPLSQSLPLEVARVLDMESDVPSQGEDEEGETDYDNPYTQPELIASPNEGPEPQ